MSKTIYCTIAAANYLPRVQILRDSLLKHGHLDFRLLLIEHPTVVARLRAELPDYQILGPDEVDCAPWLHMAFYYDVTEFSTALKPALIRKLMVEGNVVYLDPDIEVFSPLTEIEELLEHHDLVVTPHVSKPLPDDGKTPAMSQVIRLGQFNLGFIAVRATPPNRRLMDWWQDMLIEGAASDERAGKFTDQFWAAALVSFAERTHILRSARYNLAYWNVPQHELHWNGTGTPQTEDGALGFYHYSGVEPRAIAKVSKYQDRIRTEPGAPLFLLLAQYVKQLTKSPLGRLAKAAYSFATYSDGTPIPKDHRRTFLQLLAADRLSIKDPFAEREAILQLRAAPPPLAVTGDLEQALMEAQERIKDLEQRLDSLPHALVGQVAFAMDRISPGSAERVHKLMQVTSHRFAPQLAKLRELLR